MITQDSKPALSLGTKIHTGKILEFDLQCMSVPSTECQHGVLFCDVLLFQGSFPALISDLHAAMVQARPDSSASSRGRVSNREADTSSLDYSWVLVLWQRGFFHANPQVWGNRYSIDV